VVKVGSMDEQETAPFKVSRRGNADLSGAPVEVHVDGNVAKHGANTSGELHVITFRDTFE